MLRQETWEGEGKTAEGRSIRTAGSTPTLPEMAVVEMRARDSLVRCSDRTDSRLATAGRASPLCEEELFSRALSHLESSVHMAPVWCQANYKPLSPLHRRRSLKKNASSFLSIVGTFH